MCFCLFAFVIYRIFVTKTKQNKEIHTTKARKYEDKKKKRKKAMLILFEMLFLGRSLI